MNHHTTPWHLASYLILSLSLPSLAQADWPVAVIDAANATTSQPLVIDVLNNDIGKGLELVNVNTTTKKLGSASISLDKQSITYQSRSNFEGVDSFWYAFKDSEGRTNSARVTITVSKAVKPAAWPTSENDAIETTANTSIKIPVLNNDTGVGLTITSVNEGTVGWGSAKIVDNGQSILYTPASDYTGTDEFWYVFADQWGRTNAGKVNPKVTPNYNSWPSAEPDYAAVTSTATVAIPVLDNDTGEALKLIAVNTTTVGLGSAKIEENYIRYTPADGFTGRDSFWYNFEDSQGRKNSTQVFVDVTQNTELSSIEFCGSTYTTDGTAENTQISSQAADANAIEIDLSVTINSTQTTDDFNIGEYRYYTESAYPDKKLWAADRDTGANAQVIAAKEGLYIIGSRKGVLYYTYIKSRNSLPGHIKWEIVAYDGNEHKVIDEMDVNAVGYRIALLDNTTDLYFANTGYAGADYYRFNELSSSLVNSARTYQPPALVTNYIVQSLFSYNGFSYPGYFASNTQDGISYYFLGKTNRYDAPDKLLGRRNRAIVSNNRLLMTTQASINSTTEGTTALPATLYTATKSNEIVELAVCNK